MPAVVRIGDMNSGHGGFPPVPAVEGSTTVFADGIGVVRVGDAWAPHSDGNSSDVGISATGSPTVFVEGKPICRVGDLVSDGATMASGSSDTFVNG